MRYSFLFMRASGAQLDQITKLIETNVLRPILDRAYPFDEAPKPSPTSKAAGPRARSSSRWSDPQPVRMSCNRMLARVRDRLTYANVITSLAHFLGCPGRDQGPVKVP